MWTYGIALTLLSTQHGRRLGARQALAILPGLAVAGALPRAAAIPALVLLGATLLCAARSARPTR